MAVPPILPILQFPKDVLGIIASETGEDVVALRKTCKKLRDASKSAFEAYQKQLLVDRYGTHLESELSTPFYILDGREKAVLSPESNASSTNYWLDMDEYLVPKMVDYKTRFFERKSFFERFAAKYQLYRREPNRERDARLQKLLVHQAEIASQLVNQPLNPAHPLQDLRDRYRRHATLSKQMALLEQALLPSYDKFLGSLNLVERALFYVASLLHSLFKKSYTETVAFPAFPNSIIEKWNTREGVKLGETTISLEGNYTPVEIRANFSFQGSQLNPKTEFFIVRTSDSRTLGHFDIERVWTRIGKDGTEDFYYTENKRNVGKDIRVLKDRRLTIAHLLEDTDNKNGEIINLLTQLALEIFQRESEQVVNRDFTFMKKIDNDKTTIIDFQIEEPVANSLQKQIKNNPLLSPTLQGPILPKFFHTNLFRFEKGYE